MLYGLKEIATEQICQELLAGIAMKLYWQKDEPAYHMHRLCTWIYTSSWILTRASPLKKILEIRPSRPLLHEQCHSQVLLGFIFTSMQLCY